MICLYCGHRKTRVTDSVASPVFVRRMRECPQCKGRFTTIEQVEEVQLGRRKLERTRMLRKCPEVPASAPRET